MGFASPFWRGGGLHTGPDALPRRATMNFDTTTIQFDYSRWGEPLTIA